MGVAMLAGPALGGRIAEISFPLCFGISALCGLLNILVFGFVPETRDRAATSDKGRLRAVKIDPSGLVAPSCRTSSPWPDLCKD